MKIYNWIKATEKKHFNILQTKNDKGNIHSHLMTLTYFLFLEIIILKILTIQFMFRNALN